MLAPGPSRRPSTIEELLSPELLAQLKRLDFRSNKVFQGLLQGERRSKRKGSSVEFADFRPYVPGDDVRRIDWKAYARLERLFLKLFVAEEDLTVHLVVDRSASMDAGEPNKLIFAQKAALALGWIALARNNRLLVSAFGRTGVEYLDPLRGSGNLSRLARFTLQAMLPEAPEEEGEGGGRAAFDVARVLRAIVQRTSGSGVIVLLSDVLYDAGLERGLDALAAAGRFDAHLLQILSPDELDPERAPGAGVVGDVRLVDVESGAGLEATVSRALIRQYRARLEQHCARIEKAAKARSIDWTLIPSDASLSTLLLKTLRLKGLVG